MFEIESVSEVIVKVFVKTLMEKLTRENIAVIQSCCPFPCTLSMGSSLSSVAQYVQADSSTLLAVSLLRTHQIPSNSILRAPYLHPGCPVQHNP